MTIYETKIRPAKLSDCEDIHIWRNDKTAREMSFHKEVIELTDHEVWFKNKLSDSDTKIFIGEYEDNKIGVCRFSHNHNNLTSEISININPDFRSRGLSKDFINHAIEKFTEKKEHSVVAKIKTNNEISKRVFSALGFKELEQNEKSVLLIRKKHKIELNEVQSKDADKLYALLLSRDNNISNLVNPSKESHEQFVKNHPYVCWYLVSIDNDLGTFYLQNDNSIGININNVSKFLVKHVLKYIYQNFKPKKAVPSKIPSYFYVNTSCDNTNLHQILNDLSLKAIQTSFKLDKEII